MAIQAPFGGLRMCQGRSGECCWALQGNSTVGLGTEGFSAARRCRDAAVYPAVGNSAFGHLRVTPWLHVVAAVGHDRNTRG